MTEDDLKSELGFYLHMIGEASEETKSAVEKQYAERINVILKRLSEIKANG